MSDGGGKRDFGSKMFVVLDHIYKNGVPFVDESNLIIVLGNFDKELHIRN